jgi:hypothetical protein
VYAYTSASNCAEKQRAPASPVLFSRRNPRQSRFKTLKPIMFICRNQPCGAEWQLADVLIKNEGQGLMFRCPMCGARNKVLRHDAPDGTITYEQDNSVPPKPAAK